MDALLSVEPSQSAVLTAAAVEHNRATKRVLVGVEVTADKAVVAAGDGNLRAIGEPSVSEHRVGHVAGRDVNLADAGLPLVLRCALVVASDLNLLILSHVLLRVVSGTLKL